MAEVMLILVFAAAILLWNLMGTGGNDASSKREDKWETVEELNGKTFVSVTGSDYIRVIEERFPDSPIIYVDD